MHRVQVEAVAFGTAVGDRILGVHHESCPPSLGSQRDWLRLEPFIGPEFTAFMELKKRSGLTRIRLWSALAFGKWNGLVEQSARYVRAKGRLQSVYRRIERAEEEPARAA